MRGEREAETLREGGDELETNIDRDSWASPVGGKLNKVQVYGNSRVQMICTAMMIWGCAKGEPSPIYLGRILHPSQRIILLTTQIY